MIGSVSQYGAIGDGRYIGAAVSISAGSGALTAVGAGFTGADVGRVLIVPGAGAGGADLVSAISSVGGPSSAVLGTAAATTLSSAPVTLYCATNSYAAFLQARSLAPDYGAVIVPHGNFGCWPALPSDPKMVDWIGEPGAHLNVQSALGIFSGNIALADYASARDARSFEHGGTDRPGNEAQKHWNWTINPTGSTQSYQKDILIAYVLQRDPSSGVSNGGTGPNVDKDGVAIDTRAYIDSGNMHGRVFGGNTVVGHKPGSEGMLSAWEFDIANGGIDVVSFDNNMVSFPKTGVSVVSKGPNNATFAYGLMGGGGRFYAGLYAWPDAIVDHPDSRFIKLKGAWSVLKSGRTTIGKDVWNQYLRGVELSELGQVNITHDAGGFLNLTRTAPLVANQVIGSIVATGQNASGIHTDFAGFQFVAQSSVNGQERGVIYAQGKNGAGAKVTLFSLGSDGFMIGDGLRPGEGRLAVGNGYNVDGLPVVGKRSVNFGKWSGSPDSSQDLNTDTATLQQIARRLAGLEVRIASEHGLIGFRP